MGQATANGRPYSGRPARPRKGAKSKLTLIALASVVFFAGGYILLWSLGSVIVGGKGFPWASPAGVSLSPVAVQAQIDQPLEPLVNMRALRDLSYVPVKGIYVGSQHLADPELLQPLLDLADTTEINAFVVDVKDDWGSITYNCDAPAARNLGTISARIKDVDSLIATLREHHITPIARIVCFKDSVLPNARPDLAVMNGETGEIWETYSNHTRFINPFSREVWEYLVEVAEDAARHGFAEIQFDYVRFPDGGPIKQAVYAGQNGMKMSDAISGFLAFAKKRLEPLGVWISADVFGMTLRVKSPDDQGIGQILEQMAQNLDIICPMVYPSHYAVNSFGLASPNASPYQLVSQALQEAKQRMPGTGATIRPWLQDFSMNGGGGYVKYGTTEVKAEIRAAEELGYSEWLLWNASLNYTEGALRSD